MQPKPFSINQPYLFLVEGDSVLRFIQALTKHMAVSSTQVHNFGGRNELRPLLKGLRAVPGFSGLKALAIVMDAETSFASTTQPVRDALCHAGFDSAEHPCKLAGSAPATGYFVLPNNRDAGMLEDLCLESVVQDQRMECVDRYFKCVGAVATVPKRISKARAHCYLSALENPELRVGEAAQAGYWPWDSPAFNAIKSFINGIATP